MKPLTHSRYLQLLAAGGLILPEPTNEPTSEPLAKYNGSRDPAGVECLGTELAAAITTGAGPEIGLVVVWQDPEDLVLAHVVARELGSTVLRLVDVDGLVGHDGPIPAGISAVVVSDAVRHESVIRAMVALIERAGSAVVAVATLAATTVDLGSVPALCLPAAQLAPTTAVTA